MASRKEGWVGEYGILHPPISPWRLSQIRTSVRLNPMPRRSASTRPLLCSIKKSVRSFFKAQICSRIKRGHSILEPSTIRSVVHVLLGRPVHFPSPTSQHLTATRPTSFRVKNEVTSLRAPSSRSRISSGGAMISGTNLSLAGW